MKASEIPAFVAELNTTVDALTTEIGKLSSDVVALEGTLGGDIPPEGVEALNNLKAKLAGVTTALQALDDLVPEQTPPPA
jgi:hypothetical protein